MGKKSSQKGKKKEGVKKTAPEREKIFEEVKSGAERKWYLLLAVVGVVVLVSYFNSVTNTFVFDDIHLIVEHRLVRGVEKIPDLLGAGRWRGSYRPVRMVSYAIDDTLNETLWRGAGG